MGYIAGTLISKWVNDIFVTREEIAGLMANLLYLDSPPAGQTRLTDWARQHADTLGKHYASELGRRRDRASDYTAN